MGVEEIFGWVFLVIALLFLDAAIRGSRCCVGVVGELLERRGRQPSEECEVQELIRAF